MVFGGVDRFWSLPYFPFNSFHVNLRILPSLDSKINQIKLDSFIQSRKKLQELHKIYFSHFVSVFSDLNFFAIILLSGSFSCLPNFLLGFLKAISKHWLPLLLNYYFLSGIYTTDHKIYRVHFDHNFCCSSNASFTLQKTEIGKLLFVWNLFHETSRFL